MKRFTTILLLLIIFLQTFSSFVIEADYFLNRSYIAKVLCINKEKPKMHCNGKCYLAKQIKEQEKREQQAPGSKKEKFAVHDFFLPTQFKFDKARFLVNVEYRCTEELISSAVLPSIFRPPII